MVITYLFCYPIGNTTLLSGIIPHMVKEMVNYCCPSSSITFGNHFGSIRDVEDHFQDETFIDISFPIYGLKGKDSVEYKDYPFIPLVTAPRMVMLVPNSLLNDKNTRTEVLMKTIFNTWPMLVFIVVSACLAGLIVWLLVSIFNSLLFTLSKIQGQSLFLMRDIKLMHFNSLSLG